MSCSICCSKSARDTLGWDKLTSTFWSMNATSSLTGATTSSFSSSTSWTTGVTTSSTSWTVSSIAEVSSVASGTSTCSSSFAFNNFALKASSFKS